MRTLASIRKIDSIRPIEGADAIECAVVGGWTVVVKKGEFQADDLAVYCEIDSWIPNDLAPFLSKGREPREYNGVLGERLRTVKLRGQLSQGLILPFTAPMAILIGMGPGDQPTDYIGIDVTEMLGIQKWEAPIPAQLAGQVRGSFPTAVPKTDQERIQNLTSEFAQWVQDGTQWEVTEKLDGSSCTIYLDNENVLHVCSRNLDLTRDENNTFWKVVIESGIDQKMHELGMDGYALQGELIGEGVQKNPYGLKGHAFYLFDIYDTIRGRYVPPEDCRYAASRLGINHVPLIEAELTLNGSVDDLLKYAEAKSKLNPNTEREGIVFKRTDGKGSFKAISNKFLLKGGD